MNKWGKVNNRSAVGVEYTLSLITLIDIVHTVIDELNFNPMLLYHCIDKKNDSGRRFSNFLMTKIIKPLF